MPKSKKQKSVVKPSQQRKAPTHPLDALSADPLRAIALMIWKDRFRNPDLSVRISEHDMKGMDDCVNYLGLTLDVRIERGKGRPAFAGNPAKGIPAREAEPPKPFVIVSLLGKDDKGISGPIRAVENNEEDYKKSQEAKQIAQARDNAQYLGQRLLNAAKTGEFSSSEMAEAGQALILLAKPV